MRVIALAAAAVLALSLTACGGKESTPAATTAATSSAPVASQGGQETPEAAAQVFLKGFGTGDAKAACSVMAGNGVPMEKDASTLKQCQDSLAPVLEQFKGKATGFDQAKVSGATVNGDSATFENATVAPELGKSALTSLKAVKIKNKWYMTQG